MERLGVGRQPGTLTDSADRFRNANPSRRMCNSYTFGSIAAIA